MSLDLLSRDDVAALTRSRTRAGQVKVLVANGIRHVLDGHGWPVVLRSAVEGPAAAAQHTPVAAGWSPAKVLPFRRTATR